MDTVGSQQPLKKLGTGIFGIVVTLVGFMISAPAGASDVSVRGASCTPRPVLRRHVQRACCRGVGEARARQMRRSTKPAAVSIPHRSAALTGPINQ